MTTNGHFSIGEFAKYSRTTRETLLHYDRIGLLTPVSRGDNNYRYYSSNMLSLVKVIRTLQKLGMCLDEIKEVMDTRTPRLTVEHLELQIDKINSKIDDWIRPRKLLLTLKNTISSVLHVDITEISIQYLPAEAIVMGDLNDFTRNRPNHAVELDFYQKMSEKYPNMDLDYMFWSKFSEERIKNKDWVYPDRFYFHNPEGHDRRPAALYAIGYEICGYGQGNNLYNRMFDYIEANGFEICGDAYEEYPLNEVCVTNEDQYLMRVLITVREKNYK